MLTFTRLAVLTGLSAVVLSAARGEQQSGFDLLPRWKQGETRSYDLSQKKTLETDGKVVRKSSGRTTADVEVVAAGREGFVVRWKLGQMTPDDPKLAEHPLAKAMMRFTDGLTVDLEVDPDGDVLGVRNWKDLQATGKKMQEAVLGELGRAGQPKATLDVMRAETDKLFATKQAVEVSFARLPGLLVIPLGVAYEPGKVVATDVDLPNPFGGDPIPAKAEFALKLHDPATGLATLTYSQKPDPKEVKKVLDKTLGDLARRLGKAPGEVTLPAFDLTDEAEYTVESKTGWVRSVTHTRRGRSGASVQTETTTLVRRESK